MLPSGSVMSQISVVCISSWKAVKKTDLVFVRIPAKRAKTVRLIYPSGTFNFNYHSHPNHRIKMLEDKSWMNPSKFFCGWHLQLWTCFNWLEHCVKKKNTGGRLEKKPGKMNAEKSDVWRQACKRLSCWHHLHLSSSSSSPLVMYPCATFVWKPTHWVLLKAALGR